jgi:hypothetical protein
MVPDGLAGVSWTASIAWPAFLPLSRAPDLFQGLSQRRNAVLLLLPAQAMRRGQRALAQQSHEAWCLKQALVVWRGAVQQNAAELEAKLQLAASFAFESTLGELCCG